MNPIVALLPQPADLITVARGTPLYEQVQEVLWNMIFSGILQPGQHLTDRVIAERLAVSRTPVREAMRQMAREGVLETLPGGGHRVIPVDQKGLRDLYACRAALAATAVKEAVLNKQKHPTLINNLKLILEQKEKGLQNKDVQRIFKYSSKFHDRILADSENVFLKTTLGSLGKLIQFYRFALLRRSFDAGDITEAYLRHFERSHQRHQQIVSEMEAGDGDEAARLAQESLLLSSQDMDEILHNTKQH